MSLYSILQ